jgi:hypothetical protein
MAVLTKNLVKLRSEFDVLGPGRDKRSEGWIGDYQHSKGRSGHNPDDTGRGNAEWDGDSDSKEEVRAIDVDKTGPWRNGQTMEKVVQHLVKKGREGNLEIVIRYIIFNGRIWRAATGWKTETYIGPNKHTEHAHASGAWSQAADENASYNYGVANLGYKPPIPPPPITEVLLMDLDDKLWESPTPEWAIPYAEMLNGAHPTVRNVMLHTMRHAQEANESATAANEALVGISARITGLEGLTKDPAVEGASTQQNNLRAGLGLPAPTG